jgi:hypothetical protein
MVLARALIPCDSAPTTFQYRKITVTKTATKKTAPKDKDSFGKDRRRKHHHWLVTVYYADGEKFGRVYTDREKASRFAERQRRSPVVKSARVSQVS